MWGLKSIYRFPSAPAPITEAPTDLATKCDRSSCNLPYCFCNKDGTLIPGGLEPGDVSCFAILGKLNYTNTAQKLGIYVIELLSM